MRRVRSRQDTTEDVVMNIGQVADYTRYSQETIRRALRAGTLQGIRAETEGRGGNWRVQLSEVQRWLGVPNTRLA